MNKELIQKRFRKKLSSYNKNAGIQKQMAEKILQFLPENNFGSILEIGCGTGLLTELAVNSINYKSYTALDIVKDCREYIKKINSDIEFIPSDIEKYIQSTDKKFDLIISNASLQWIENLPEFTEKLTEMLNKNGILLFSTFGEENFREICFILGKTLTYPSKREWEQKLSKFSYKIEEELRIKSFKTPKEVLKHIQNTGVNAISEEAWTKRDLICFEEQYNAFCASHPTLTYHPVYVYIQK